MDIENILPKNGPPTNEVNKYIDKYKKDLFNFRFQKINSQVTNPSQIGQTKKIIARI